MSIAICGATLALLAGPRLGAAQQAPIAWPRPGQLVKAGVALHSRESYFKVIAKH